MVGNYLASPYPTAITLASLRLQREINAVSDRWRLARIDLGGGSRAYHPYLFDRWRDASYSRDNDARRYRRGK